MVPTSWRVAPRLFTDTSSNAPISAGGFGDARTEFRNPPRFGGIALS